MDSVFRPVGELVATLASTGPIGAAVAALVVGLALTVIIFAQLTGIFADRRTTRQQGEFQARLLVAIKDLTEREENLNAENRALREEVGRLAASVELLREQNRRLIELLRKVVDGRIAPNAIPVADLGDGAAA